VHGGLDEPVTGVPRYKSRPEDCPNSSRFKPSEANTSKRGSGLADPSRPVPSTAITNAAAHLRGLMCARAMMKQSIEPGNRLQATREAKCEAEKNDF
jgi:hypothetical protein